MNKCPVCNSPLLVAPGIGPYCPNKACEIIDNLTGATHSPLAAGTRVFTEEIEKLEAQLADFRGRLATQCGRTLVLESALRELSAMYAHCWDMADGSCSMLGESVPRFEKAHAKAQLVLKPAITKGNENG